MALKIASSGAHGGRTVSHAVIVLILFALVSVCILSWTLPHHQHHGHEHHHGLAWAQEERRFALQHVARPEDVTPAPKPADDGVWGDPARLQRARDTIANLKNGTDFFADYEVKPIDEPEVIDPNKKYYFHYPSKDRVKYPFVQLSRWPRVYLFPEFITDEEADAMIRKANATMARSRVVQTENGGVSDIRTSTQTWLDTHTAPVAPVSARLRELTGVPDHELLQILRYEKGQRYGAHPDYFKVTKGGLEKSNRAITAYIYLSDVEEGGETAFIRADGRLLPRPFDPSACDRGLRVRPKKRSLAMFYDMTPDGHADAHSIHSACPVKKGVKWGFTLWFHVTLNNTETGQPVVGFDF